MTRSYEAFSKKLHDSLQNKEEGLKYFDTYPYEPEEFYRRQELGLPIERPGGSIMYNVPIGRPYETEDNQKSTEPGLPVAMGSNSSTMDEARRAHFGKKTETRASQTIPKQLNQASLPTAKPPDTQKQQQKLQPENIVVTPSVGTVMQDNNIKNNPVVQDKQPSHSSPKTQSVELGVDPKLPIQDRISNLGLSPKMDADLKRYWEGLFTINEGQRSSVDFIRSLTIKFAKDISKNQESTLSSAFNTLEVATTIIGATLDFYFDRSTEKDWKVMIEQVDGRTEKDWEVTIGQVDRLIHLEDLPFHASLGRLIFPILMASEILQESLSEASAEMPNDQELPSWTAVMEFFEYKAGYAFERCLSDYAVSISEMVPDEKYVSL